MENESKEKIILGLDVGTNSIGWALLTETKIVDVGVRIFEAGMEGDIKSGREESRNLKRRDSRSARRRLERLVRRLIKLAHILQKAGLLPQGDIDSPRNRHEFFKKLDDELLKKNAEGGKIPHTLPYLLRAKALDKKLEPYELGRALYHICQRRGFLSNRKAAPKKDEEAGVVKKNIAELRTLISDAGARTLGEYFSKLDIDDRIRAKYTARDMYDEEFEKIWEAQVKYHSQILTDELKKGIKQSIFYQRPLKLNKNAIGPCEFETNRKRAPIALLESQRFRMIQQLKNTRIRGIDGRLRELTPEEIIILKEKLDIDGDMSFKDAKKLLGLKTSEKINWEEGEEKRFLGNRTAHKLVGIFGEERWKSFSEFEKNLIVEDILSIVKNDTLERRGIKYWKLSPEKAKELSELELEQGYFKLSRRAISNLLPLMMEGLHFSEAVKKAYGDRTERQELLLLPPVKEVVPYLANPAVMRALTELRKIVNTLLKMYGKPDEIHIEFARELKKSKAIRKNDTKKMRENESIRKSAADKITKELHIENPSDTDKLKVRLAEECNWICPYTGKSFGINELISTYPQLDIEHIIPFAKSLDNSFANKTLCFAEENRNRKHNQTPNEAYSSSDNWDEIISRVKDFKGRYRDAKLEKFQMTKEEFEIAYGDFTARQLTDTSYSSKLAQEYMGHLYGSEWRKHIIASKGEITSYLRRVWKLNSILKEQYERAPDVRDEKTREDHRHHAVDAIAIAMTNRSTVKMLSDANQKIQKGSRLFAEEEIKPPWDGFWDDVNDKVQNIVISHRVSHKVSGALHEETLYGQGPDENEDGKPDYYTIRKKLDALTKNEIENIIDPKIREMVKAKLNGEEPSKIFKNPDNLPTITRPDGRIIKIKKAQIKARAEAFPISEGVSRRNVLSDSNHHVEIYETSDKKGRRIWDGEVVSLLEAKRRLANNEPVIKKDFGEGKKFLFSLSQGDTIELDDEKGNRRLYVVRILFQDKKIAFVKINDARLKKTIVEMDRKYKDNKEYEQCWRHKSFEPLRQANCRKVIVDSIGCVRRSDNKHFKEDDP